jgi:hypothetical protein
MYCIENKCKKSPGFNFANEKSRLYCKTHAKEGMVDIKTKKCLELNCVKQPCYNVFGEKHAVYCKEHVKEDMVNVKTKRCIYENCTILPSFNLPNKKVKEFCYNHKTNDMIDIKHKRCLEDNCITRPSYNYPNIKTGIYCKQHCKINMVDVTHPKCKECNEIRVSNKIYKGHCLRCFVYKFPEVELSRNFKIKERYITDFIKEQFCEYNFIFDKIVNNGCSKRRPDAYVDLLTHVIIIEVDENQHSSYESICENKRVMELFIDFGQRPIIFIRFNPDNYLLDGKKIKSCFSIHETI